MQKKYHFIALVAFLVFLGTSITMYKIWSLGFSLVPDEKVSVWTVESTITFTADGGPVEVSLNLPDNNNDLIVVDSIAKHDNYTYQVQDINGVERGIWRTEKALGPQKIYNKSTIYRKDEQMTVARTLSTSKLSQNMASRPQTETPSFTAEQKSLATSLIAQALQNANAESSAHTKGDTSYSIPLNAKIFFTVSSILHQLNTPESNADAALLLENKDDFGGATGLACAVLQEADIIARPVKGFFLDSDSVSRHLNSYIEVQDGDTWVLFDLVDAVPLKAGDFLLWQRGQESVFEVVGGTDSAIKFSSMATEIMANKAAISAGLGQSKSLLVDFSIYSLPIQFQNTFRLLLLIPFGALVVAIMRNLVGIRTSGTFLPILIALTFIQTSLLVGLALFLLIVSLGLVLRSYLSHLNLLLVPRISAVLVFVIIIYLGLAVGSYKMGSDFGLMASYFPMIIIAWTIERMSVLWEEEGPKEVCIQCGGSLLTASLVYVLITSSYIKHISYSFPELLLVVLAVILCIGSYTGYRLSELRRFEPLGNM